MIAIVSGDVCLLIIYLLSNGWFEKCSAQVVVISCRKLVGGGASFGNVLKPGFIKIQLF
jgi:hypothetical protein